MGVKPTIKSSRDITPDDLKQHNEISLGTPSRILLLLNSFLVGDFTFEIPILDVKNGELRS